MKWYSYSFLFFEYEWESKSGRLSWRGSESDYKISTKTMVVSYVVSGAFRYEFVNATIDAQNDSRLGASFNPAALSNVLGQNGRRRTGSLLW